MAYFHKICKKVSQNVGKFNINSTQMYQNWRTFLGWILLSRWSVFIFSAAHPYHKHLELHPPPLIKPRALSFEGLDEQSDDAISDANVPIRRLWNCLCGLEDQAWEFSVLKLNSFFSPQHSVTFLYFQPILGLFMPFSVFFMKSHSHAWKILLHLAFKHLQKLGAFRAIFAGWWVYFCALELKSFGNTGCNHDWWVVILIKVSCVKAQ